MFLYGIFSAVSFIGKLSVCVRFKTQHISYEVCTFPFFQIIKKVYGAFNQIMICRSGTKKKDDEYIHKQAYSCISLKRENWKMLIWILSNQIFEAFVIRF